MNTGTKLVRQNVAYLEQGKTLITNIEADYYARLSITQSLGTVGSHYRHVLDRYRCFLNGMNKGVIRYELRDRDKIIETSARAAVEESDRLIARLKEAAEYATVVDSLEVQETFQENEILQLPTSFGRELKALANHTIHHYAIIALIFKSHGMECHQDFGVAPSTLEYRSNGEN